jgi:hypothetical protein
MSAELRQLQERCDAFDALADALRTPDSWLSYRVVALRDQLQECERQDAVRPSTLEQVCTAIIDRDEALRQARADLERMRTLAANWETEVVTVRNDNLELYSLLWGGAGSVEPGRGEGARARAEGQGGRRIEGRPRRQGCGSRHRRGPAPAGAYRPPGG